MNPAKKAMERKVWSDRVFFFLRTRTLTSAAANGAQPARGNLRVIQRRKARHCYLGLR